GRGTVRRRCGGHAVAGVPPRAAAPGSGDPARSGRPGAGRHGRPRFAGDSAADTRGIRGVTVPGRIRLVRGGRPHLQRLVRRGTSLRLRSVTGPALEYIVPADGRSSRGRLGGRTRTRRQGRRAARGPSPRGRSTATSLRDGAAVTTTGGRAGCTEDVPDRAEQSIDLRAGADVRCCPDAEPRGGGTRMTRDLGGGATLAVGEEDVEPEADLGVPRPWGRRRAGARRRRR